MKPLVFCIASISFSAIVIFGFMGLGHADPKVGDRIGDWFLACSPSSAKQKVCALTQTLANTETKKPLLSLLLRRTPNNNKLALFVTTPLGVYLAAGIAGKIDRRKQFNFIWQRCTTQGCVAATAVDTELERALKAGKSLLIGFKAQPNAKTIALSVSLIGVTKGLKALDQK